MRNEININQLPTRVINNLVLVEVEDVFMSFTTGFGIQLVNLTENDSWGDSNEYNISEFVMRYGKVILAPEIITKGSFNYKTKVEIKTGDIVFWNLICFQDLVPLKFKNKLYLLVDYHEIHAKETPEGKLIPINGFGLFKPVSETFTALLYSKTKGISDEWILEAKPENNVVYDNPDRNASDVWENGDKVRLLVRQSPYKLEGTIRRKLEKELYACPMNFVICTS
jgi:hypothetical protein